MSRKVVEIPVEVWEFSLQDAEHIAALHRETLRLMNENARLKAEVERLRASSFVTAVPVEEYEKLKAEVERLRKAGDAMAETILKDCIHKNDMAALKWYAANREQGCLVNPIKVAQYLPKPPTKEGKQP